MFSCLLKKNTLQLSLFQKAMEEQIGKREESVDEKTTGDKRKYYNCNKCRYRTDRKNNLKRHLLTMHENCSKLLECCNVVFLNKSALKEHVSEFHAGAGYACLVCNRKFSRKALMKRHSMVHNGTREFNCHGCDYTTSHKSNLDRHIKRHQPSPQNTSEFGPIFTICNDVLSSGNMCREESEGRNQQFDERLHRIPWCPSPFYHHFFHSNLEYMKHFYRLHDVESKLVVFKKSQNLCPFMEETRRNFFVHFQRPFWRLNYCQLCQQDVRALNFYCNYENREIQQRYLFTWMNMMRSFTAKQLTCKESDDDRELLSSDEVVKFKEYPRYSGAYGNVTIAKEQTNGSECMVKSGERNSLS